MCVRTAHVCECAYLAAYCQGDNLLDFSLGRLCWHDLDGTLLCGRQGPPPSGIFLCTKIGFKKGEKKRKPPQAPALAV